MSASCIYVFFPVFSVCINVVKGKKSITQCFKLPQNWCSIALVEWNEPFHLPEHGIDEEYQIILKKKVVNRITKIVNFYIKIEWVTIIQVNSTLHWYITFRKLLKATQRKAPYQESHAVIWSWTFDFSTQSPKCIPFSWHATKSWKFSAMTSCIVV